MFKVLRDLLRYNLEFLDRLRADLAIILCARGCIFFAPYPTNAIYLLPPDMPPSAEYWLGTTSRGQDVFWQISAAICATR